MGFPKFKDLKKIQDKYPEIVFSEITEELNSTVGELFKGHGFLNPPLLTLTQKGQFIFDSKHYTKAYWGGRTNPDPSPYTPGWTKIAVIKVSGKWHVYIFTPGHWTFSGEDYVYGKSRLFHSMKEFLEYSSNYIR